MVRGISGDFIDGPRTSLGVVERPSPIQMKKTAQITVIVVSIAFPYWWIGSPRAHTGSLSFSELSRMDECARPIYDVLLSPGRGQDYPFLGNPALEGGGHVRDGDVARRYGARWAAGLTEAGWEIWDRSWLSSFCSVAALGAVSIGLQRQSAWRASIVRPSAPGAIGRTA
jgi:hypothetical protein